MAVSARQKGNGIAGVLPHRAWAVMPEKKIPVETQAKPC
jgi:hypothetical protein